MNIARFLSKTTPATRDKIIAWIFPLITTISFCYTYYFMSIQYNPKNVYNLGIISLYGENIIEGILLVLGYVIEFFLNQHLWKINYKSLKIHSNFKTYLDMIEDF